MVLWQGVREAEILKCVDFDYVISYILNIHMESKRNAEIFYVDYDQDKLNPRSDESSESSFESYSSCSCDETDNSDSYDGSYGGAHYSHRSIHRSRPYEESSAEVNNIQAAELQHYIVTFIPELWEELIIGDLIIIANMEPFEILYAVDENVGDGTKMIVTNHDYNIPPNFYAWTRFPMHFHKYFQMKENNRYARYICDDDEYHNYSRERSECRWKVGAFVPFDRKLLFSKLTVNDIQEIITYDIKKKTKYDHPWLFVVVEYKNEKTLFISGSSNDTKQSFLKRLKNDVYVRMFSDDDSLIEFLWYESEVPKELSKLCGEVDHVAYISKADPTGYN